MGKFVIGISGCSYESLGVLGTTNGKVIGICEGGGLDYYEHGYNRTFLALQDLISCLLTRDQIRTPKDDVDFVAVGVDGIYSSYDRVALEGIFECTDLAGIQHQIARCEILSLIANCLSYNTGILIHAGLNSYVYGRNHQGKEYKVGGMVPLTGFDGGAYYIARDALVALFRARDGRGVKCPDLLKCVLRALRLRTLDDLLPWLKEREVGVSLRRRIATELVIPLGEAAMKCKDEAAISIITGSIKTLVGFFNLVLSELNIKDTDENIIIYEGGLMRHCEMISREVRSQVSFITPKAKQTLASYHPAAGALLLACSQVNSSSLPQAREEFQDSISKLPIEDQNKLVKKQGYEYSVEKVRETV